MKSRIDYRAIPEFERDLKKLSKRFPTIEEDLALAQKAVIELHHIMGIDNSSEVRIAGLGSGSIEIMKITKFACRSLPGRGAKSGIRVIYAIQKMTEDLFLAEFLEIYFKGDKENEDRERIGRYLKERGQG